MSVCKSKGCSEKTLVGSAYCKEHQLTMGTVRQRTQGPNSPSKTGATERGRKNGGRGNNPPPRGKDAGGAKRGGKK
jgi:hypothetical protein